MAAETEAPQTPPAAELLERGRYAIEQEADGSWFVLRATPICEKCQVCGCGEQQDPIQVPAMFVPFLTGQATMTPGGAMSMIKKLMSNGH